MQYLASEGLWPDPWFSDVLEKRGNQINHKPKLILVLITTDTLLNATGNWSVKILIKKVFVLPHLLYLNILYLKNREHFYI